MMQRSKNIARRQQKDTDQTKRKFIKECGDNDGFAMSPLSHPSSILVSFDEVCPMYENVIIGNPQSFQIEKGTAHILRWKKRLWKK